MADTVVERRNPSRFFCHRCNVEFEDVLQEFLCPYCASGFIEQLETEADSSVHSGDDISDADMSTLDDSDDINQSGALPMLNDLAFLMTGGRARGPERRPETLLERLVWSIGGGGPPDAAAEPGTARPETLLEHLVWTIGGGGPPGAGASPFVLGGAPFVLVGAPGDYVFGGEGLDAVVTQLLGQLENSGPPPLTRECIQAIPSEAVTPAQAAANQACSVCWDNFLQGETISRLECDHIFHSTCIEPWLQLHATCPICRRSLQPPESTPPPGAPAPAAPSAPPGPADTAPSVPRSTESSTVFIPRPRGLTSSASVPWENSSSSSLGSSVSAGGLWAPRSSASTSDSSSDRTSHYSMDIEYD